MPADILPPRPLKVSGKFVSRSWAGAILLALLGAGCVAGGVWLGGGEIRGIRHDARILASGLQATDGDVHGQHSSSHFVFEEYDLSVSYHDQAGVEHSGKVDINTLFSTVANGSPVDIRYDPAHPDDFAISWARDLQSGRWTFAIVILLALSGFGVACFVGSAGALRRLRIARACGERSEEVLLDVESFVPVMKGKRPTGRMMLRYRVPVAGMQVVTRSAGYAKNQRPLFVGANQKQVLALRSLEAAEKPVLLREDFYPYALDPGNVEAARAEIARRAQAPGAATAG